MRDFAALAGFFQQSHLFLLPWNSRNGWLAGNVADDGVRRGTVLEAGRYSGGVRVEEGSVVYSLIFLCNSSDGPAAASAARPQRDGGGGCPRTGADRGPPRTDCETFHIPK